MAATSSNRVWDFQIFVQRKTEALAQRIEGFGWQVYATSLMAEQLPLDKVIETYRREYPREHNFRRLKGTLAMQPFYLQKKRHLVGLVHFSP